MVSRAQFAVVTCAPAFLRLNLGKRRGSLFSRHREALESQRQKSQKAHGKTAVQELLELEGRDLRVGDGD